MKMKPIYLERLLVNCIEGLLLLFLVAFFDKPSRRLPNYCSFVSKWIVVIFVHRKEQRSLASPNEALVGFRQYSNLARQAYCVLSDNFIYY
jgi:hypothetical protein